MADINYIDLPEKTTPSVSWDKVLITDSEDWNLVKIQEALQFKWPQGEQWEQGIQGIQWIQWIQGIQWEQGEQGIQWVPWDNAPELEIEYSIDWVTSWHTPFTSWDFYQRVSTDWWVTWSSAIKFVWEDWTWVWDMLKSVYDPAWWEKQVAFAELTNLASTNLNTITDNGFYCANSTCTNLPENWVKTRLRVNQDPSNSDLAMQEALTTTTLVSYVRTTANGWTTWTSWARIKATDETKANKTNVLELDNTTAFTPDNDYEPATKKYVDDKEAVAQNLTKSWLIAWEDMSALQVYRRWANWNNYLQEQLDKTLGDTIWYNTTTVYEKWQAIYHTWKLDWIILALAKIWTWWNLVWNLEVFSNATFTTLLWTSNETITSSTLTTTLTDTTFTFNWVIWTWTIYVKANIISWTVSTTNNTIIWLSQVWWTAYPLSAYNITQAWVVASNPSYDWYFRTFVIENQNKYYLAKADNTSKLKYEWIVNTSVITDATFSWSFSWIVWWFTWLLTWHNVNDIVYLGNDWFIAFTPWTNRIPIWRIFSDTEIDFNKEIFWQKIALANWVTYVATSKWFVLWTWAISWWTNVSLLWNVNSVDIAYCNSYGWAPFVFFPVNPWDSYKITSSSTLERWYFISL